MTKTLPLPERLRTLRSVLVCQSMKRMDQIQFRPALADESEFLSDLALRSKAHWGYSAAFLDACRAELSYSQRQIEDDSTEFVIAMAGDAVAGFYALKQLTAIEFELEALFVEPDYIGQGFGRALLDHAKRAVVRNGGRCIVIQGDPHAENFYRAAGGTPAGHRNSESIPGRRLPVLSIDLTDDEVL